MVRCAIRVAGIFAVPILLMSSTAQAGVEYVVGVQVRASPDDAHWSVPSVDPVSLDLEEYNGRTWLAADTGWHDAMVWVRNLGRTVPAQARASASASLRTGEVGWFIGGDGIDYFYTASASANAYFFDYVTFDMPAGMTECPVTFKLAVVGDVALNDITWQTGSATAYLNVGATWDSRDIYRGWDGLVTPLPFELSITATVSEGTPYRVGAQLLGDVTVKDVSSYIDVSNTGRLSIEMPQGVTFLSTSNELFADRGPVPEPATLWLWPGLLGFLVWRSCRAATFRA